MGRKVCLRRITSNKALGDYEGVKIDFGLFRVEGKTGSARMRLQG